MRDNEEKHTQQHTSSYSFYWKEKMDNINLPHAAVADLAYHEEIEQCPHAIVIDLVNNDNDNI